MTLFKWDIWVEEDSIRARLTHEDRYAEARGNDVPEAMNKAMDELSLIVCCPNLAVTTEFRMGRYVRERV